MTGRLIEESVCEGACHFTYDQAATATVNDADFNAALAATQRKAYIRGDEVTVTGSGLAGATVTISGVDCQIISSTDI